MITLYGIKNCDTIKKARHWLEEHGIDYRFHDYRVDGIDLPLLKYLYCRTRLAAFTEYARHNMAQTG